jgi:hypothetical protein
MAKGEFIWFDQAYLDLGNKIHDFDSDVWKWALVTDVTTPTATTAAPHWGGTGTTDFSANEVSEVGGNYTADGETLTSLTWTVAASILKWDFDDIVIAQSAANPTDARWIIFYNSTDANKRCVAAVDMGGIKDLTDGSYTHTVPVTNGIMRIGAGTIT